ncbi:MAG: hypothetical protein LIO93_08485 [Bacteroidales bacterium]|nr:hypothetical protein [Bacteroidales bacterium]
MPIDIKAVKNDSNFYDLEVQNGDFVMDESTFQHQGLLFLSAKGDFKEHPTRCVDAGRFVEARDSEGLAREIGTEFSLDDMKIDEIEISIPKIKIEARYEY